MLDAAERVMAEHGFDGATVARVVEEAGHPGSSVYHYYGSKDGILLAVMERGADPSSPTCPGWAGGRDGRPSTWPRCRRPPPRTLERHPHFLRLLIVLAALPPRRRRGVPAVIGRVRGQARGLLRTQIALRLR